MGSFAPLSHAAFRLLLAGRVTSMLGNAMAPIALAFAVLDVTSSVTSLGVVVAGRSIANVVFLLWGGVFADRLPRQFVLVGSSAVSFLSQSAIAALVLTGHVSVPLFAVLSVVNGMSSAFALPASAALVPQTIPAEIRQQANALLRLGVSAASIAGASLGGLLIAFSGPGWGLAVDALTFALSGLCFAFVRVPAARLPVEHKPSVLAEMREGWTEFVSRTWVWVVVAAFMFVNMAHSAGIMILGPAIADETVGRQTWGFVLAAQTAGMVVGAVVALRIKVRRLLLFGCACIAVEPLLAFVLAVHPTTVYLLIAGFLTGVALEQFGVAWETSLQHHVPEDKLARVYSYDMVGSFVAIPLAQLAVGPVSAAVGVRETLLWCVGIYLVATVAMVASKSVRSVVNEPVKHPVG